MDYNETNCMKHLMLEVLNIDTSVSPTLMKEKGGT